MRMVLPVKSSNGLIGMVTVEAGRCPQLKFEKFQLWGSWFQLMRQSTMV